MYPALYEHIRTHPGTYLRNTPRDTFDLSNKGDRREERKTEIDEIIAETVPTNVIAATSLIDHLFPQARGNRSDSADLRRNKRVGADWYFERYFTYAIPSDTVADQDFAALITYAEAQELDSCIERLQHLTKSSSSEQLAQMMNLHAESIPTGAVPVLVKAVSKVGCVFSEDRGFMQLSPQAYATSAIEKMVGRIRDVEERQSISESVVQEASTIKFAISFRGWASPRKTGKGNDLTPFSVPGSMLELARVRG